jgi:hypothetical protein
VEVGALDRYRDCLVVTLAVSLYMTTIDTDLFYQTSHFEGPLFAASVAGGFVRKWYVVGRISATQTTCLCLLGRICLLVTPATACSLVDFAVHL